MDKISVARDIAKQQMGAGAIVTSAQPGRTYQGQIIGIIESSDTTAIQAVGDNHAILHDIKNVSEKSNLEIGQSVTLVADAAGYSAVQGRDAENHSKNREHSREGHKR